MMFTTVHRHRDGTDLPVEILMQAIPGDDGAAVRYVKIVRDVRERIETDERLRQAEQHLRVVEDRERIARDLHDIVIQKLFAAGMTIQSVSAAHRRCRARPPPRHGRRRSRRDDPGDPLGRSSASRPMPDTPAACAPRCCASPTTSARPSASSPGSASTVRSTRSIERIADELLPTLREALSNVAKHAEASSVEIVVESGDQVTLRVLDNGRGMPVTLSSRQRAPQPHRARHQARRDVPRLVAPRRRHRARMAGARPAVAQEQSASRMSSSGSTRSVQLTIICSAEPASASATIRSTRRRPHGIVHFRPDADAGDRAPRRG